jgi:argininosuccinate lyase
MRLYVRDACDTIDDGLQGVARALLDLAEANADAILPGYTHLQRAQPVLLAHHFLAYIEMLERDRERIAQCRARANVCPLGSGALAGTTFTIDRKFVADTLGFPAITRNSLDAVSDRDFVLDLLYAASVLMMHLSRLCEEIVLWSSAEFGFITLDDAYATGSSMMPQKKNPSVAELVRGKTGRVYGHLLGLLTVMKGLPLSYNQDMQEDKEGLFDTVDTVLAVLHIMPGMLRTMTIHKDTMLQAAHRGFTTATDLADHLVRRGLPFRQAYDIVGHLVRLCLDQGKEFHDLTILELQAVSPLLDEGALAILTPEAAVAARAIPGGTAPREVMAQIQAARQRWGYPAP